MSRKKWLKTHFILNYFDDNRWAAIQKFDRFHESVPGGPGPGGTGSASEYEPEWG